jgi:hypothetical protein
MRRREEGRQNELCCKILMHANEEGKIYQLNSGLSGGVVRAEDAAPQRRRLVLSRGRDC